MPLKSLLLFNKRFAAYAAGNVTRFIEFVQFTHAECEISEEMYRNVFCAYAQFSNAY